MYSYACVEGKVIPGRGKGEDAIGEGVIGEDAIGRRGPAGISECQRAPEQSAYAGIDPE
ncbi:MAG: hypothetical protein HPY71_07940 [Firmicutes bacterium]|nr:hypothetical protein [Bacillota bacterium]